MNIQREVLAVLCWLIKIIAYMLNNAKKKVNMSKYDIIRIIFKGGASQMYIIVLLPNIKRTYNQIGLIKK